MPRLPVVCTRCDFIGLVSSSRLGLSIVVVDDMEVCPGCGELAAQVVPATYNLWADEAQVVKASTGSMLWLQKIARHRPDEPAVERAGAPMVRLPGAKPRETP